MTKHIQKISKYTPGILQGVLQLEVERPRTGLAREFAIERRAFSILSTLLIVLIAAYLYFVASSILNVMGRADAERSIRSIESNVATLEQQYLALSNSVSTQTATEQGLAEVQNVSYVYRPGNESLAAAQTSSI